MSNALTIITTVVAIIASVLISRYFFIKSIKKELSVFTQIYTKPFERIDPTTREKISVIYDSKKIDNLCEIQFLIGNTGEKAITNLIKPLTLEAPKDVKILDATLLHQNTASHNISVSINESRAVVNFSLLNKRDYFIVKFLVDGYAKISEYKYTIECEELPGIIEQTWIDDKILSLESEKIFHPGVTIAGLIFSLIASALFLVSINSINGVPNLIKVGLFEFFKQTTLYQYASIISFIPALAFCIVGILLFFAGFFGGSFPPKKGMFKISKDNEKYIKHRPFFIE